VEIELSHIEDLMHARQGVSFKSMKDRQPGWQSERGPNYGLPTVLGDQSAHLPSERLGRPLTFSLRHVDHEAEIDLITPKKVRESGREIVHREIRGFASGRSILPLTVAFVQPLRACESATLLPSLF
jgi:hypothetical protein